MVHAGDIIVTSYGTGPYVVVEVVRDCRCPDYLVSIDCDGSPCGHELHCFCGEDELCPLDNEPHMHLVCVRQEEYVPGMRPRHDQKYWLNGVIDDAGRLREGWRRDKRDTIHVVGRVPAQMPLFMGGGRRGARRQAQYHGPARHPGLDRLVPGDVAKQ